MRCVLLLVLTGCVGDPSMCATTWGIRAGASQSYREAGGAAPEVMAEIGGEFGSDRCSPSSEE